METNTLSEDFADTILPATVFIGILAVVGVIGNLCVLYVYKNRYPHCNFRYFVMCLAIIDLCSCLFVIPSEIYTQRNWFSFPMSASWFCKLRISELAITVFMPSCILLLISVDRFRKACCPFGWQIKTETALLLCVLTCGVSSIVSVPVILFFGVQSMNTTYANQTVGVTMCLKEDAYKATLWPAFAAAAYYICNITFMGITMFLYGMILRKMVMNANPQARSLSWNIEILSYTSSRIIDILNTDEVADINIGYSEPSQQQFNREDSEVSNPDNTKPVAIKQEAEKENWQDTYRRQDSNQSYQTWTHKRSYRKRQNRIKRKSVIMFTVTLIFNITTFIYICILTLMYLYKDDLLLSISKELAAFLFFLWRLYFINHVINPIVYGLLDRRFNRAIRRSLNRSLTKVKGKRK